MFYSKEKSTHDAFVERVRERAKALGLSNADVAAAAEIKDDTFKNMIYKGVEIGRGALVSLAGALNCSVEYLATGGYSASDIESGSITLSVQTPEALARSLNKIAQLKRNSEPLPSLGSFHLPKVELAKFGVSAENVRAVQIDSETLSPTLSRGDTALIDIGATCLSEGVFIIAIRDSVVIRFVSPISKGFSFASSSPHIYGTTVNVQQGSGDIDDPEITVIGKAFSVIAMKSL
jgi:hypothetical protein